MKRLCERLFTTPQANPLSGIYAYAVTNHVFTQKVMEKYGINDCAPALPDEASVIQTGVHASEQNAEIWISKYGVHAVKEVKALLRDLCLKQMAAINLMLNLEDPATYFLTSEFESLGFFFGGILPQTDIGDTLILQYLNNVAFDYDKVQVHTAAAKDILAYVKAHDPNMTG